MIKTVIKRDGSEESFDLDKLKGWSTYAAKHDIEWLPLLVASMDKLHDRCSTKDIMQAMIDSCVEVGDEAHLKVAARLMRGDIYKMVYGSPKPVSFSESYRKLVASGHWNDYGLSQFDLVQLDEVFDPLMDKELEYASLCQFKDKYGLGTGFGHKRVLVETPQLALMGIAIDIFYNDGLEHVIEFYKIIKKRQINIATPIMASSRTGINGSASCFVYTSGDTLDSIAAGDHLGYLMSANRAGIGTEYDIRSINDSVAGGKCQHAGKLPHYKALQAKIETAKQGVRSGAATISFNVMDPEIDDLLRTKHPTTDESKRFPKTDFSMVHNMDFLRRVIKNADWCLVSRADAPELYHSFYYDRSRFPGLMDKAIEAGLGQVIKARDILKLYLRQWQETGRIYSFNVDHANDHTPFLDTIRISNLCVAPETQILTSNGYEVISDLEGSDVDIWNGSEWSTVTVQKTGEDQRLIRVVTDSGQELECTPYHKFYVQESYGSPSVEKRAHELEPGDKLIKGKLPIVEGTRTLDKAWQNGFYSGDGCVARGRSRIYLYGPKRTLLSNFDFSSVTVQDDSNRIYGNVDGLEDKYFVPSAEYTIQTRLDWLAGYMDADGCIYRNGSNEQLVATSVEKEFLRDVQLMLQTLGVNSKVKKRSDAGYRLLPANDGTGEMKEFWCRDAYRLLITSEGLFKLSQLGISFKRLEFTPRRPQRSASQFVKIEDVIDEGRVDDTYCFNEPKRHLGMFGGLLTGQCQEIALPTNSYLSVQELYDEPDPDNGLVGLCFLLAIDVAKTSKEEYKNVAYYACRALDNIIDKMYYPLESLKSGQKFRSIGVGMTNLAYYLAREGLSYSDQYSRTQIHELAEMHQYWLCRASTELAKERGAFEWFDRTKYKDGHLCIDTYNKNIDEFHDAELMYNWEKVRRDMAEYGMRFSTVSAHMPCESSSAFGYSTNGLYPIRKYKVQKSRPEGLMPFPAPGLEEVGFNYELAWDIDPKDLYKVYGIIQKFTCQGISADTYLDKTKYEGGRVPLKTLMENFLFGAKVGMKSNYYFNTDGRSAADKEIGCSSCDV